MDISVLLQDILQSEHFSNEDNHGSAKQDKPQISLHGICFILNLIGIEIKDECSTCKVFLYKQIEDALIRKYKDEYGISISQRIYSINEIHGLILFLYMKQYETADVDPALEAFFEKLFFSSTDTSELESLQNENTRLINENKALSQKIEEMNCTIIESCAYKEPVDVNTQVLHKLEHELIILKEQVEYEHTAILEAWYHLAKDALKK
ncbi:hypothetical protein CWI42_020420 [Ordospora colligata]|uniref:Uncharacterized protein n=1 Tax=Ordospora colligata OC4 TaxID=1354746 RepID=A0A0B2UMD6_9MICR|nr:uncharacterized protein M896_020430 [Ordospora colligata OC4]KHN70207.1 hypothetical protein M896_020430 [Ordospora colligata OC4]TBU16751.1 hypothetical protein CWI41_020440 [Ordospora colligata]TBU17057.1 hypothetical protein CWI40_020440 [Ordospora colligata]TBU19481.1 hypothetical protein CWI42_020420 [Ordospora colligata]